MVNRPHQPCR